MAHNELDSGVVDKFAQAALNKFFSDIDGEYGFHARMRAVFDALTKKTNEDLNDILMPAAHQGVEFRCDTKRVSESSVSVSMIEDEHDAGCYVGGNIGEKVIISIAESPQLGFTIKYGENDAASPHDNIDKAVTEVWDYFLENFPENLKRNIAEVKAEMAQKGHDGQSCE